MHESPRQQQVVAVVCVDFQTVLSQIQFCVHWKSVDRIPRAAAQWSFGQWDEALQLSWYKIAVTVHCSGRESGSYNFAKCWVMSILGLMLHFWNDHVLMLTLGRDNFTKLVELVGPILDQIFYCVGWVIELSVMSCEVKWIICCV